MADEKDYNEQPEADAAQAGSEQEIHEVDEQPAEYVEPPATPAETQAEMPANGDAPAAAAPAAAGPAGYDETSPKKWYIIHLLGLRA